MSFVYDYGGQIAVLKSGKWKARLDSPQADQALTVYKSMVLQALAGEQDDRRGEPVPEHPVRQGPGGLVRRQRLGVAVRRSTRRRRQPEAFASEDGRLPDAEPHQGPVHADVPRRLRPRRSRSRASNKALAADWIKAFTGTAIAGTSPRPATSPTRRSSPNVNKSNPELAPFAQAAKYSWFVPTAPELGRTSRSANVLKDMLTAILTNKRSVKAAAHNVQPADHEDPERQGVTLPAGKRDARHELPLPGRRCRRARPRGPAAAAPVARPPLVRRAVRACSLPASW